MTTETPPPGSEEAVRLGCLCPVMDNHYGRGFEITGHQSYWYNADCPLHEAVMRATISAQHPVFVHL